MPGSSSAIGDMGRPSRGSGRRAAEIVTRPRLPGTAPVSPEDQAVAEPGNGAQPSRQLGLERGGESRSALFMIVTWGRNGWRSWGVSQGPNGPGSLAWTRLQAGRLDREHRPRAIRLRPREGERDRSAESGRDRAEPGRSPRPRRPAGGGTARDAPGRNSDRAGNSRVRRRSSLSNVAAVEAEGDERTAGRSASATSRSRSGRRHCTPVYPLRAGSPIGATGGPSALPRPRGRAIPGSSPSRVIGPTATRTSRNVGWPTAAVIRRTWRFRPSRRTRRIQAVGTFLRNRIGTGRSGRSGLGVSSSASAGRVGPSARTIPSSEGCDRLGAGIRSTWARYVFGCSNRGSASRWASGPSSVRRSKPSLSRSSRPSG